MEEMIGLIGLLTVGAISPGPNNVLVLRESARGGWPAAARVIAGVVAGGLSLLALCSLAAETASKRLPGLADAASVAGAALLAAWGGWIVVASFRDAGSPAESTSGGAATGAGAWTALVFQFVNPKAWLLMLTLVSATRASESLSLPALAVLFAAIATSCLALWSALGKVIHDRLEKRRTRRRVDRLMGFLLLAFAVLLAAGAMAPEPSPPTIDPTPTTTRGDSP